MIFAESRRCHGSSSLWVCHMPDGFNSKFRQMPEQIWESYNVLSIKLSIRNLAEDNKIKSFDCNPKATRRQAEGSLFLEEKQWKLMAGVEMDEKLLQFLISKGARNGALLLVKKINGKTTNFEGKCNFLVHGKLIKSSYKQK